MVRRSRVEKHAVFAAQYARATSAAEGEALRARAATFDGDPRRIELAFTNGAIFSFPVELVEGLDGAPGEALAEIELRAGDTALHWERLDVDLEIAPLLAGIFGTGAWMRELGRRGGSVKSKRKARAARRNGAKGGRPRLKRKQSD